MRGHVAWVALVVVAIVAGCATPERPSGAAGKDSPPPVVKPYE